MDNHNTISEVRGGSVSDFDAIDVEMVKKDEVKNCVHCLIATPACH